MRAGRGLWGRSQATPSDRPARRWIVCDMGTRTLRAPASHRPARLLTGLYALATLVALLLTLLARRRPHPFLAEGIFGLLNVPVAPTFVSVVVLALATRALRGCSSAPSERPGRRSTPSSTPSSPSSEG